MVNHFFLVLVDIIGTLREPPNVVKLVFFLCSTSNWRCTETLEEYLMKRNIMGICKYCHLIHCSLCPTNNKSNNKHHQFALYADDVDTRAVTRRLREDGSLIGVLSTDQSRTDDELLEMAKNWKIVGMLCSLQAVMSLNNCLSPLINIIALCMVDCNMFLFTPGLAHISIYTRCIEISFA